MSGEEKTVREYAFFDLDLTLVPFDTQLLFGNFVLRREPPWRRLYLAIFLPCLPFYALGLIGDRTLKRIYMSYLWRMPRERVREHARAFGAQLVDRFVYPEVRAEFEKHRAEGRVTVLNSASPEVYVEAIAEKMGFDHAYGTRVIISGRQVLFPAIEGANNKEGAKLPRMEGILPGGTLDAGGEVAVPLPGSYAYSDSSADLPLLRIAEHAVMVHPSERLRAAGEKAGWRELTPPRPYAGRRGLLVASLAQAFGLWKG